MTPDPPTSPNASMPTTTGFTVTAPGVVVRPNPSVAATATPSPRAVPAPAPRKRGAAKRKAPAGKRPRKASGAASKAAAARQAKVAARTTDTLRLVQGLRAAWEQAVASHKVRVTAQFGVLQAALQKGKAVKPRDVEKVRAAMKLRVKGHKGRAKDLRHVEEALALALGRVRDA